jgi:hypothetical protein
MDIIDTVSSPDFIYDYAAVSVVMAIVIYVVADT